MRNKIDLLSQAERDISAHTDSAQHWQSQWYPTRVVSTSALTGDGIAELITAIAETLIPNPPAPGTAVPFAVEQIAALEAARVAIAAHDAAESLTALRPLLPFCVVGEFAEPTPARPGPSTPG